MAFYLVPFYVVDPELAIKETRVITTFDSFSGVPPGEYGLIEFYCPDPACDCRRVMINVAEHGDPGHFLASISYAFDRDDPDPGPFLDPLNEQSVYAEKLMELVVDLTLSDPEYLARLERHYRMIKTAASDPGHPAYEALQASIDEVGQSFLPGKPRVPARRVGRNEPCPCGSGRKYKHCCGRR